MSQRLPNWENRLNETIAQWRDVKFRWDRDCARWAAACIIAVTGDDPIADLRGRYSTKRQAFALLAEKSMEEWVDERLPRIHPAFAQRGDIALVQDSCLGVVIGGEALFYSSDGGMTLMPRSDWQAVWGVGHG
ncbi:DUF6950 family protein [Tsuneonella suprasediminis]|uniref:DUF6950 family protein n=1 Tax=Tsuneonella suprasediminis TaxID=2306996 RepID=UPI002F9585D9